MITSPKGRKFLGYISPIYEQSVIMQAVMEAIGAEWDDVDRLTDEVLAQLFPQTATWGIVYWERLVGIPRNDSLSIEQRRARVLTRMQTRWPMTKERMEQLVRTFSKDKQAFIREFFDQYRFEVFLFSLTQSVDLGTVYEVIEEAKPAHLAFKVIFETDVTLTIQAYSQEKYSFGYPLTGTVPDTNIVGVLQQSTLLLDANMEGNRFDYQLSGTGETGEYPETNMVGDIEQGSILPSITAKGSVFDYQLCGEAERDL